MDYIPPCGLWHPRYGKYGSFVERIIAVAASGGSSIKRGVPEGSVPAFDTLRRDHLLSIPYDPETGLAAKALLHREVVRKFAGPDTDSNMLAEKAKAKFWEAEAQCFKTNQRWSGRLQDVSLEDVQEMISVRNEIQTVLGAFSWDKASRMFGWGPGSTTRVPYKDRHSSNKYSGKPHCTPNASLLATAAMRLNPRWFQLAQAAKPKRKGDIGGSHHLQLVAGNEVLTVPKDDRSDRTIAREPCLNLYLQRGIGGLIRQRLAAIGLDLNTQENNRNRCLGGKSLEWATIDLSMASDTLAYEVVRILTPEDWFAALDDTRSTVGVMDDTTFPYEKFSSMGNGYTFELESLIFLCIVRVVVRRHGFDVSDCLVFGDDIIVPEACAESVIESLASFGFVPNVEKSFFTGPYRESCGMQTWYGDDISPFYIKRPIETSSDLYLLHNNLQRWLWRVGMFLEDHDVELVKKILKDMRRACFSRHRFYIPDGFGDGGFIRPCGYLQVDRKRSGKKVYWEVTSLPHLIDSNDNLLDDLPVGAYLSSMDTLEKKTETLVVGYDKLSPREHVVTPGFLPTSESFREFVLSCPVQPVGKRVGFLEINTSEIHARRLTEQWLEELS